MNAELLNKVVAHLAQNGIVPVNTPEFKNAVFGLCITTLVSAGLSVQEATDAVLGDGSYQTIADNVLDGLYA